MNSASAAPQARRHQIVIVGGGAGGLSLAARLGRKYRRNENVRVLLIDHKPTHLWKPLLHEVATGSLDSNHDEVSYVSLARKHGFQFMLGRLESVNGAEKTLSINRQTNDPLQADSPFQLVEQSSEPHVIAYDQVVLAIGSMSNDFGTPGVLQHAILLDNRMQAEKFHRQLIAHLHRVNNLTEDQNKILSVVIVGGGATGVELAADLHNVASQLEEFGFRRFKPENLNITVIEAGPRLLAQLPERISHSVEKELHAIGVDVRTDTMVSGINAASVQTREGQEYVADLCVWAAGIRAPAELGQSGLATDPIGRVFTTRQLNVPEHPEMFVIGDCCHCALSENDPDTAVPPREQSAHQMAGIVYKNITRQLQGKSLKTFEFQDYGSLVSLSEYSTVGNLMGNLMKGTLFIEGWVARFVYRMLYRRHQAAVHGIIATGMIMIGDRIHNATHSHLKLH
ncbi:MAG: NAD(P)/FAD-dependent oxidoreductase [Granulosicoccus sp.]|nr:NAD(P)/FAD-dependent oxidoreductase [Granulosicoccus sp.]